MPADAGPPGAAPPGCTWQYHAPAGHEPVIAAPGATALPPGKPLLRHYARVHKTSRRIVKPIVARLPVHHARKPGPAAPLLSALGAGKGAASAFASGVVGTGVWLLVCSVTPTNASPHLPTLVAPPTLVTPPTVPPDVTPPGTTRPPTAVPEPGSLALVASGLALLLILGRKSRVIAQRV